MMFSCVQAYNCADTHYSHNHGTAGSLTHVLYWFSIYILCINVFQLYFIAIESTLDLKLKLYLFLQCIFSINNIGCQRLVLVADF